MAGKRVAVISPDGQFGTVDEAEVEQLPDGARVLTKQQVAERAVQERYDALPTAQKALGVAGTVLSAPLGPLGVGQMADAPPSVAAFGAGVRSGLTAGLLDAGARKAADAIGGKEVGDKYAARVDEEREASPVAHTAGAVTGMVGGAAIGPGAGAARALPSAALGTVGTAVEHGVARALGGLATRGALGQAATTGAKMAVRGAIEGAAYTGAEQASSNILHDTPDVGEKVYAAMGHGFLTGGALGGALGFSGSLAASGARKAFGGSSRALAKGEGALPAPAEAAPRGVEVPFIDADAGLKGAAPAAESPFSMGAERRPVQLRPDVGQRGRTPATEGPLNLTKGKPVSFDELFTPAGDRPPSVTLDADAGIARRGAKGRFQGPVDATDALKLSSAKNVPRDINMNVGDEFARTEARSPIRIPEIAEAPKPKGILAALADPTNAARGAAQEQAWSAFGRGNGFQTTRFAKQAQKYFGGEGGTKALGEVAIRHGLIDMGAPTASPLEAAWAAAKSGTAADILPKAEIALETVGRQIGEITDASGARISVADVRRAIRDVRAEPARLAGREHVVAALDAYEASLVSKLGGEGATARVQDVLEQRKGLDKLVYEEAKTLDPKGRVAVLRDVRAKLEQLISTSLDDASGQVPGQLRERYATLKKDFHALSIIQEAAEDSAARASKHSTFGFSEKLAIGGALASGNVTAAPVLAVGGKMLRERGNAAAAAYLSRAADQGTFASLVRQFDMRVSKAAAGVLRESNEPARLSASRSAGRPQSRTTEAQRAATDAEAGRAAIAAKKAQGAQIVKWVGDVRANPKRLMEQLEEAAELVGQSAGPTAAESYTGSTLRAINFIAGHVPVKDRRDPLDPRSVPPLTYEEADRLILAATYATKPETVFDDFGRGKVTPEGLRAAQTFMPAAFAEFRMQLQGHVEDHVMRNRKLTQSQRLRIDKLLGYPAGADLRPEAIQRNQANYAALEEGPQGPPPASPPTGNGPVNMTVQQTGFDAVEARAAS